MGSGNAPALTAPLTGAQRPRVAHVPASYSTAQGEDAVELAASAGLFLDDWQAWTLAEAMGVTRAGLWSSFEVGLLVPRQNGKNAILEARELAGLYLLDETLLIHTAHEFKTALEHFRRVEGLIKGTPDLRRMVRKIVTSHGSEGIELFPVPAIIAGSSSRMVRRGTPARRLQFLARSRSSGKGFSADFLAYDEAMILSMETVSASMPTMSAMRNPQLWYTASEGRADAHQLARVRRRGLSGRAPDLMWAEWSAELCHEMCPPGCDRHDLPGAPATWAKANPAMGVRIPESYLSKAHEAMDADTFAMSHLAVSDWPADENGWAVISEPAWDACGDTKSARPSPRGMAIAVDATEDGTVAAIAIAGKRGDGKVTGEIPAGDHRPGTAWVVERLVELRSKYKPCAIVIDPHGPAGHLIDACERAKLEIVKPSSTEIAQAYGLFIVSVRDRKFVHLGNEQPNLRAAVAGAVNRDLGDGNHAWSRKLASVDLSPLIAVTLATWGHNKYGRKTYNLLDSIG